jgi:Rps23 Pro-64 3,4-dihydroxylase Tpa1-like proline 4-hydroxylase
MLNELSSLLNDEAGQVKTEDIIRSGNQWKKNKNLFVDDFFQNYRDKSMVLSYNRKLFDKDVVNCLLEHNDFFRYIPWSNMDNTLVSYYEDGDLYKTHVDGAVITAITWFYHDPKNFEGGDLILGEKVKVECKHNRCVVLSSMTPHEVTPVKMLSKKENSGRYSMSQFLGIKLGN